MPPWLIAGDRRITLEGNRYGMFMFEANHQCVGTVKTYRAIKVPITPSIKQNNQCTGRRCVTSSKIYEEDNLQVREERIEIGAAWNRCDPYVEWSWIQRLCRKDPSIRRIAFTFDHSINGGPFYRIVDEANICGLVYKPFSHNDWIKLPPEAPVVGVPLKDGYRY